MLFGIFHLCPAEVSHQAFFLEGFHELLVLLRPIVVFIPLFEIFHVGVFVNALDLPVNPAKTQRFFQRLAGLKRFRGFLFAEAVVLLGGLMFAAGFVVAGLLRFFLSRIEYSDRIRPPSRRKRATLTVR